MSSRSSDRGHVLLSYECDSNFFVVRVKEHLEKHGYLVWLDGVLMLDDKRMAEAVEGAVRDIIVTPKTSQNPELKKECLESSSGR